MQGAVPPLHIRLYGMQKSFSVLMIAYTMWIYGIDLSSSRRGPVRISRQGKGASCFINLAFEQSRDNQFTRFNGHQSIALLSVVQNWLEDSDSHCVTSLNTTLLRDITACSLVYPIMETTSSSVTQAHFYHATRCYIPEDKNW